MHATDARAVLAMVRDASELLARMLEGGHTIIAGRMAGVFRSAGHGKIADEIMKTMAAEDEGERRRAVPRIAGPAP